MSLSLDLDRAPTLDELLRGCIDAFDAQGKVRDPHLVRLFLTVHPWYLPPAQLAADMLRILEDSGGSPEGPTLRLKIGHLVRYWVRAFPGELAGDPELLGRLRELREALGGAGGGPQPHIDLESLSACPDDAAADADGDVGAVDAADAGDVAPPRRPKARLLLERLEAAELAALLTHLEHGAFARLRQRDLRSFARGGGAVPVPSLWRVAAISNGVSRWVQHLVLSPTSAPQRAQAIARCLLLAEKLLELRNFNSLLAVVGGLGSSAIARLTHTLALLPPHIMQLWSRLSGAVWGGPNFRAYRGLLGGAGGGFRLPALGVHLRDLLALEAALPDWGGPARPHPAKLRQRFAILGALLGGAGGEPPLPAHLGLLPLLRASLALGLSEEQLYQLSLQREPRQPRPPAGPPPALPPPGPPEELALPDPPRPDPARLRAQLERLVEWAFRQCDVDGDGRISREEFGILRENFPHLREDFGQLDTDRDGGLSRGEVLAYFLRWSQEPPPGPPPAPPHRFQPSSALRPAPCAHCGRLILGLHKQALKCCSCGLRCHPPCAQRLRLECRRRSRSVAHDPPPGPPPPGPPRPRAFSCALPRDPPAETPEELQEPEDGVFDTHL